MMGNARTRLKNRYKIIAAAQAAVDALMKEDNEFPYLPRIGYSLSFVADPEVIRGSNEARQRSDERRQFLRDMNARHSRKR